MTREYQREYYARQYSAGLDRRGPIVQVPDDIERLEHHEPCFLCGSARGCRHRMAA